MNSWNERYYRELRQKMGDNRPWPYRTEVKPEVGSADGCAWRKRSPLAAATGSRARHFLRGRHARFLRLVRLGHVSPDTRN